MKSRLDRYRETEQTKPVPSRLSKNRHLYDDLNNKIGFEELTNFDTQTRIELTSLNSKNKSRENYHQLKDYQGLIIGSVEIDNTPIKEEKEKVFDINSILEEARKNRTEIDELEKKRKLKDEEYNILADLNKKYLSKEKDNNSKDEYEGLEELINTITSKTLAGELKKEAIKEEEDLLSDLVATSIDLQVNTPEMYEKTEINSIVTKIEFEENDDEKSNEKDIDDSFYTRSMDLSEHDFDFDELAEKKSSVKKGVLITLVVIILLIIIGVVTFFILKNNGIDIMGLFS